MKKKVSIFLLSLFITGCNIQNKPDVMPLVKPSVSSKPTPQMTPSSSPSISVAGLEKYFENTYCRPMEMEKAELNNPVRIAVSRDGQYVYTMNALCPRLPDYPNFGKYKDYCHKNGLDSGSKIVPNNIISKISKDGKIEILKLNDKPVLGCYLGNEVQISDNNEIYITSSDENLYKISNNTLIKIIDFYQKPYCYYYEFTGCDVAYPFPRMSLDNDKPYFVYTSQQEDFQKTIDKSGNLASFYAGPSLGYYKEAVFTVKKGVLYSISRIERLRKYILPSNPQDTSVEVLVHDLKELDTLEGYDYFVDDYVTDIKVNSKGEIFFNDLLRNVIWEVNTYNVLKRFAGDGKAGFKDGKGTEAEFNFPSEMTFDAQDNLYIADTANNAVRKITPDGTVSTFYKQGIN